MIAKLKVIGAYLGAALLFIWTGARLLMDAIGRSTLYEDAQNALSLSERGFNWLFQTPAWVPGILALALTIFLVWYSWPSPLLSYDDKTGHDDHESGADGYEKISTTPDDPVEADKHERIELFIIKFVLSACYDQFRLQEIILHKWFDDELAVSLAKTGLHKDWAHWEFNESFEKLSTLGGSPMSDLSTEEMIEHLVKLEKGPYQKLCHRGDELAKRAGINVFQDDDLAPLWEKWRESHNALVLEYDELKCESRFGTPLYRPQKESRWGGIVEAPSEAARNPQPEGSTGSQWPNTSDYDLPIKLKVIDELLDIVGSEKQWEQLFRKGDRMAMHWKKHFEEDGPKKFETDLEAYRQECETMLQKIGRIRQDNERYQDIWTITGIKHNSSITKELRDFMEAIRNVGDPPSGNFDFFITPFANRLRDDLKEFGKWRFKLEKALFERRKQLSS